MAQTDTAMVSMSSISERIRTLRENIRRAHRRSGATVREYRTGAIFPALPGVTDCFTVVAFEREQFLVLGWLSPDGTPRMTWAFVLGEAEPGSTRLVVRARGGRGYHFHWFPFWLTKRVVPPIHVVMQRKQLLGLACRAQCRPALPPEADRTPIMTRSAA